MRYMPTMVDGRPGWAVGNQKRGWRYALAPYAVDLFKPAEVTLCTKNSDASIELTRLSDSPSVRNQIALFSLGEIWTAEGDEVIAKKNDAV